MHTCYHVHLTKKTRYENRKLHKIIITTEAALRKTLIETHNHKKNYESTLLDKKYQILWCISIMVITAMSTTYKYCI
jgi:hypothetical protein